MTYQHDFLSYHLPFELCHSTLIQLPREQGGIQRGKDIHTVKKMECAQMDMEKLDLHHSFLKCCRPQIHLYYILDNILMEIVNDLALKTP